MEFFGRRSYKNSQVVPVDLENFSPIIDEGARSRLKFIEDIPFLTDAFRNAKNEITRRESARYCNPDQYAEFFLAQFLRVTTIKDFDDGRFFLYWLDRDGRAKEIYNECKNYDSVKELAQCIRNYVYNLSQESHTIYKGHFFMLVGSFLANDGVLVSFRDASNEERMLCAKDMYRCFRHGSELDNAIAQYYLAQICEFGLSIPKEGVDHFILTPGRLKLALTHYLSSAEQGFYMAQYALGRFYEEGYGIVEVDLAVAKALYLEASKEGDARASLKLQEEKFKEVVPINLNDFVFKAGDPVSKSRENSQKRAEDLSDIDSAEEKGGFFSGVEETRNIWEK